jgi:molybdenum cofactor biosynthesis enzyme MoaA
MATVSDLVVDARLKPAQYPAQYQGYLDARSTRHVAGWIRNIHDPAERVAFEVCLRGRLQIRVLHCGVADRFSGTLVRVGVGDGIYAFHVMFPSELTPAERDRVFVRPVGGTALPLAHEPVTEFRPWGCYQGYIDARSTHHLAGWVYNLDEPTDRVAFEVVLPTPEGERVLHRGRADRFSPTLVQIGVGDGTHAFSVVLDRPVSVAERDLIEVRPVATGRAIEMAPNVATAFEPIAHVALDIVNNCNLRCPFCVYDYEGVRATRFMSDETFEQALRLIPFVTDGNFWLSCLHEPSLHPGLMAFIARVPQAYRRKLYYTTNLAKRMPQAYFAALADSGMHHLNISVESLSAPVYEKMRKGARFRIFQENWDRLLEALPQGKAPPPLRYNIMCYRSNLHEIPHLVEILLQDKRAWQVELRHTYDVPHLPDDFRNEEFLTTAEWAWLKAAVAHHDKERVVLLMPPGELGYVAEGYVKPQPAPAGDDGAFDPPGGALNRAPRPFNIAMTWDGTLRVYGFHADGPNERERFTDYAKTNIHFLDDPLRFLLGL